MAGRILRCSPVKQLSPSFHENSDHSLYFRRLCAAILPVEAQTKATLTEVDELLNVMKFDHMVPSMMDNIKKMQAQAFDQHLKGANLSPEDIAKEKQNAAKLNDKTNEILKEELSPENLKAIYVPVYTDVFTEDEVRGLIAFLQNASRPSVC